MRNYSQKKHFQHPILGAFIFKLLRLLCGQNDCLCLSYYICFLGLAPSCRLQQLTAVLPCGCQLLRGQKYTCAHFQGCKTACLPSPRAAQHELFIFGIKRTQLCDAANNAKEKERQKKRKKLHFCLLIFLPHVPINHGDLALAAPSSPVSQLNSALTG